MPNVPYLNDIDPSVIAAAQRGDDGAHAAIYHYYADRLFTLIYRIVPRRSQAEDLLQEVFVEVLRGIDGFAGSGSFGGWLRSIAVNKCLTQLRSPWQRGLSWLEESFASQEDARHAAPSLDVVLAMQTELENALRQLSAASRAVVWLHDVEGYTHSEIGHLLGRTASFSKSQLARAHERLRDLLTASSTISTPDLPEALPCPSVAPLSNNS